MHSGIGGILGADYFHATQMSNCVNYANISGYAGVGGVAGKSGGLQVSNCINYGSVSASNGAAGGIIGSYPHDILNCSNYGTVSSASDYAGGIVGYDYCGTIHIKQCVNYGQVAGATCGGIFGSGMATQYLTIEECFNAGKVEATKTAYGITANTDIRQKGLTINCYNIGTLKAPTIYGIGNVRNYYIFI